MSTTVYITLEQPIAGFDPNARDRVQLAAALAPLDKRARKLKVTPLGDCQSYTLEDLADVGDEGEDEELPGDLPPVEWFPAEMGLASVRAVMHSLEQEPLPGADGSAMAALLADLHDCETVLTAAAHAGVRFRLHVGE